MGHNTARIHNIFRSTLPARGATQLFSGKVILQPISIHAPARGTTVILQGNLQVGGISIHAPARGATEPKPEEEPESAISIHAPARGATYFFFCKCIDRPISIHAPARGATERRCADYFPHLFQSTLPQGERPIPEWLNEAALANFNPRSRKGSDFEHENNILRRCISIHAPARGATGAESDAACRKNDFNPRSRKGSDTY